MAFQWTDITIRVSSGNGNNAVPPVDVRRLALDLEEAEPSALVYQSTASANAIYGLLVQAAQQKISQVMTDYRLDPGAGDQFQVGHEIDPNNPGTWSSVGDPRGIVYPVTGPGNATYYVGFMI